MKKVILVDTSTLFFPCVFNWERQMILKQTKKLDMFIMKPHYVYFTSLLSSLKKIGVDDNTKVIMALEGKSWRKNIYAPYKAQREGDRAKHTMINWDDMFNQLNQLHKKLDESTNFYFVRNWQLEADDIISVACRFFSDCEKIIISCDGDLKQLCYYPDVKFFNIKKKCKGSKGMYENVKDPIKILADKSKKGDVADNILVSPNETKEDAELRYTLVNLLELPEDIEEEGRESLHQALSIEKNLNLDKLPKFKNVKENFMKIYDKKNVISYDYCINLTEKRTARKKKKKCLKHQQ